MTPRVFSFGGRLETKIFPSFVFERKFTTFVASGSRNRVKTGNDWNIGVSSTKQKDGELIKEMFWSHDLIDPGEGRDDELRNLLKEIDLIR